MRPRCISSLRMRVSILRWYCVASYRVILRLLPLRPVISTFSSLSRRYLVAALSSPTFTPTSTGVVLWRQLCSPILRSSRACSASNSATVNTLP